MQNWNNWIKKFTREHETEKKTLCIVEVGNRELYALDDSQ